MPQHKSLLVGMRWVAAGRKRKCYHNPKAHVIHQHDAVLEVRVGMSWQGYCEVCGREMIRLAIEELRSVDPAKP